MNPSKKQNLQEEIAQSELDRLVEGELDQPQRRELIARIEKEAGGWRRCALAFLEAQSWRRSLQSLVANSSTNPRQVTLAPRTTIRQQVVRLAVAIAATLLVGIVIGRNLAPENSSVVESPQNALNLASNLEEDSSLSKSVDIETPPDTEQPQLEEGVQFLGYVNYGDENEQALSVPILSGPGLDEKWLASQPAPLSDYQTSQLERRGWRVKQERRLMKIQYTDGRMLTVPIDSVRYQFSPPHVF